MSKPSQGSRLVELAAGVELFSTPEGEPFATFEVGDHLETAAVRSKAFRRYLARLYHRDTQAAPNAQAVQDALGVLEGRALYEGETLPVYVRVAEFEGAIYLDLCDEQWEVVEITSTRWAITTTPPVKFRRARGMLPLPVPVRGGSVNALYTYINVTDESARYLVVAWLLAALRPRGPYPGLVLHGEQGSAKSTTARVLRMLVDPNTAALRAEPRDERDVMIAATNGWVVALDNVSHLKPWLSDALCRLATGGGFATRELYTDADEVIFDAQRPVMLNGIEEIATRGDLLDRALLVDLPAIPEVQRRAEGEFWAAFEAARPRILGALLDGVVTGLRELPTVQAKRLPLPRMADFALWVTAAEPALAWPAGAFMAAYTGNREAANDLTLDASALAGPLRALAGEYTNGAQFMGTATALLAELRTLVDESVTRQPGWPKSARGLSGALRRLAPNLRAVGVRITFEREAGGQRSRLIQVSTVPTVPTDPDPGQAGAQTGTQTPTGTQSGGGESLDSTGNGTQRDGRDEEILTSSATAGGMPVDGAALLALAQQRRFPGLPLRPGVAVPAGAAAWGAFTRCGTVEDRAAAWTALGGPRA